MRFLLKYPSRSRPRLFQKRVENWQRLASGKHELYWLCSFDRNDPTMTSRSMCLWCTSRRLHCYYGFSKNKVQAVNNDMDKAPPLWDVLVLVSDDMAATAKDWDEIVARDMQAHFPDLNGALWYLDGRRTDLCTLSIMGRPVYEELKYVYHPAFETAYCDDFFQAVMQHTQRMARIETPVFRHEWRQENNDALMVRNEDRATYARDKATFERLLKELKGG